MISGKSWQLGTTGTLLYWLYDSFRIRLNRSLVQYLMRFIAQSERNRILEAGSGPAYASSLLSQSNRVCLSVAADLDIDALREARRRDPELPVVVADLYHLPFASGVFDLVWNSSTLEHLEDPALALREMKRVTCHHGHLFAGVPYQYGPLGIQSWIAKTRAGAWIGTVFDANGLHAMFSGLGLRVIATNVYFLRFFVGILAQKP